MSELGRVLRLDARRAALLVAVPLLTGIGIVTAWLSLVPGVAYWDNSIVALINSVRLLGPVAAGLAAWAAVRERGLDYLRDLSPRSPATGALLDLLLLAGAAALAYGTVTIVVTAETVLRQAAGRPPLLGVLVGGAALILHVTVGYLAARLFPRPVTAVAVMALTWSWAALRTPGTSWWSLLPPATFDQVELFTGLRLRVLADQVMWALGGTATLILGYVTLVTRRMLLAVPLLLALIATGAATVRLNASDGDAVSPASADLSCRHWPLQICVHPALRSALPALMTAVTPLATRLSGTPGQFTRVVQRPGSAPIAVVRGTASIHLDDALSPGYELRAVQQIKDALADPRACAVPRYPGYRALVDAWLLGRPAPSISDAPAARRFGDWSEDRRRAWLRSNYAEYHACGLGPRDFRPAPAKPSTDARRPSPRPTRPRDLPARRPPAQRSQAQRPQAQRGPAHQGAAQQGQARPRPAQPKTAPPKTTPQRSPEREPPA
ncbi:hypothetical protein [Actinomadura sp. 9N407]|uniref:hypothetical protein n=1 Tax=Actinomadura sp. 9N407 TaxID=3375154 RepID=UPI00378CC9C8